MTLRLADRVVCIEDLRRHPAWPAMARHFPRAPILGARYTVRDLHRIGGECGVYLDEIRLPAVRFAEGWHEPAFLESLFRRVAPSDAALAALARFAEVEI